MAKSRQNSSKQEPWTQRDRVLAILDGKKPDRLPFIDRIEFWYTHHLRADTFPQAYREMSLNEIHSSIGMGRLAFITPYSLRLRGVEVTSSFEGEMFYRESDPVLDYFPGMWDLAVEERAGVTITKLKTPVGELRVQHEILEEMIAAGTKPYLKEHLIKDQADFRTVEYILERCEYVSQYERFYEMDTELGDMGFLVPDLHRIPFQQILLEYLGEVPLFYALHDYSNWVDRLLTLLDQQLSDIINRLAELPVPYVEFPDNLEASMTNPKLFREYCLPYYRRYADALHHQKKRVGSHTDGNVKPLLELLAESGLDVCESFTPAPITDCTFEEAWNAWRNGPIIWGGIPSLVLDERISEEQFRNFVDRLLQTVGDGPIILGVGDAVMAESLIERVRTIAKKVEDRSFP